MSSANHSNIAHARKRIVTLDFWRGICLLMIFIDHIPGNPLSLFTLCNWGFSDAAEIFVFLAGFSAALAYGRYFADGRFIYGTIRTTKRAWQLFCANILLILALSAIVASAGAFTDSKPIMKQFNFLPFFLEPDIAIVRIVKLQYMPNMTDILPMYVVFTATFPIVYTLMRFSVVGALSLSFLLWLWANITGQSFANYPEGEKWFFNPMAWQFLFICGMAAATHRDRIQPLLSSRFLLYGAIIVVLVGVIISAPWTGYAPFAAYRITPPDFLSLTLRDKTNLSSLRLLHFLAVLFLTTCLLPQDSGFWQWCAIKPVTACGRHALPVYCVGVVLSLVIYIFLRIYTVGTLTTLILNCLGVALLVALALVLERVRIILSSGG